MKRDKKTIARAIVSTGLALGLAASLAMPQTAMAGAMTKAEKLRRLDIMLMVTGLRCRAGADDFQGDFVLFEARHMPELNRAAVDLEAEGVAAGLKHDEHMVDRLSTAMANNYGNGHPWLGCHELKGLTRQLASVDGEEALIAAAEETLSGDAHAPSVMVAVNTPAAAPAPAQPAPTPPAPVEAPAAPTGPVALAMAAPAASAPAAVAPAPAAPTTVAAKAEAPKTAVSGFNADVTTI
ncbi:hypothetical protein [Novosphingobium rosa]|uniref:hypothetical protein n=1 Tax=Novosphingobium rosa TaxID=76978 RepID=UPI00159C147D|nr:hypothetical protein [Novosphingobium rosa]